MALKRFGVSSLLQRTGVILEFSGLLGEEGRVPLRFRVRFPDKPLLFLNPKP